MLLSTVVTALRPLKSGVQEYINFRLYLIENVILQLPGTESTTSCQYLDHGCSKWFNTIGQLLPLALLHMLHTCNNTDGNKLMIFSAMALYYSDILIYDWPSAGVLNPIEHL